MLRLALILGLASACASSPEVTQSTTPSPEEYFPLAVGNTWTYRTTFGQRMEENTVAITRRDGASYVDSRDGRFTFDEDGLRDAQRYLLRKPLLRGTTWQSVIAPGRTERYEIVDDAASVTVPAGTFRDALIVRGRTPVDGGTTLEVEWAYAPSVGLVRTQTTAVIGGKERVPQLSIELTSYKLTR